MRTRAVVILVFSLACSGFTCTEALSADAGNPLNLLAGVRGIFVHVNEIDRGAVADRFRKEDVSRDVESILRHHEIRVLSEKEFTSSRDSAMLYVAVALMHMEDGLKSVYSIDFELMQPASLNRTGKPVFSSTWKENSFGIIPRSQIADLREKVREKAGKFVRAYYSVNPKELNFLR